MYAWVLAIWIIAAVMGCWGFSLFVRSISELLARRRVHLTARRSKRAIVLALCLMLVCGAVSLFAGLMALHLERKFVSSGDRWTTPLMVIGASVCLFALCLIIWAIIGDRSRGRKRCPKCWYDMSGALGLQCSECGKTAKSERRLSRARRPRWAFVLAVLMIIPAVYAMVVSKRVTANGPLAAIPTWVLIAGWERLPEAWIIQKPGAFEDANLEARLSRDEISRSRMQELERTLYQPLLSDPSAQSNARRVRLLHWLTYKRQHWDELGDGTAWTQIQIDIDAFLQACAEGIYNILIDPYSPMDEQLGEYLEELIALSKRLVVQRAMDEGTLSLWERNSGPRLYMFTSEILQTSNVDAENRIFLDQLWSDSPTRCNLAHELLLLTNRMDLYSQAITLLADLPPERISAIHFRRIAQTFFLSDEEDQNQLMRELVDLSSSVSDQQRRDALTVVYYIQRYTNDRELLDELDSYEAMISFARSQLKNKAVISFDTHDIRFQEIAIQVVNAGRPGDADVYQSALDLVLETGEAPKLERTMAPHAEANLATDQWLATFGDAQLARSTNPQIRKWYIDSIPVTLKTPHNDTLNQLAVFMLDDEDPDIRQLAIDKLYARMAMDLIPDLVRENED